MASGAISGVASGAAAGAAFGPWGAVIGGALGGIGGLLADDKAKEGRRLLKKSNALRTDSAMLRSFAEQRLLLRQAQLAKSTALAQGVASGAEIDSSGSQGVRASIQNQMLDNFLLGESILDEQLDANVFEARAGKKFGQSQDILGMVDLAASLSSLIPQKGTSPGGAGAAVPGAALGAAGLAGGVAAASLGSVSSQLVTPGGLQSVVSKGGY